MQTKTGKMKTALVLVLCVSMLATMAVPAFAAQKITNPGNFGPMDGIVGDVHNSYAWCTEMFAQTDGDYLWVGTNRDMGRTLLGLAGAAGGGALEMLATLIGRNAGLPDPSEDQKGKIYRQRASDSDAAWELMYENPAINGYRRMILFKGDLYICAGLTNGEDYDYSIILRFGPGFKPGDTPEIVMWEDLPRDAQSGELTAVEYFRAACVYEGKLYIGTFDSKIYVTDGTGLADLTPKEGAKATGWALFADLKQHPDFQAVTEGPLANMTYIWDMAGFNGSLYAVVTYFGFNLFKLTPQADGGPVITQVVGGSEGAKYSDGMGVEGLVSASPYVMRFDDKDYLYLGTFANGPMILANFGLGSIDIAFNEEFCSPSIFRLDEDENCEVVVGDRDGKFAARDKAGNVMPVIGNQRAGFATQPEGEENLSFNQYIWWMAQYEGKLYATTWDLGVFKRQTLTAIGLTLLGAFLFDSGLLSLDGGLPSGGELLLFLFKLPLALPGALWATVKSLGKFSSLGKYNERSNPAGFDLYVSEDGVNFSPVTLSGFGNEENYGGRVLLPTQHGLFVCTANPFGGAQVWRMDGIKKELQPNIPATVSLKVGETLTCGSLRGLDMPNGSAAALDGAGDYADIALVRRSESSIIDTTSTISRNLFGNYVERQKNTTYPMQMYDLVFTGETVGEQDVTMRFSWNGIEAGKTVKVIVTE